MKDGKLAECFHHYGSKLNIAVIIIKKHTLSIKKNLQQYTVEIHLI